ncbi:PheS-related mystery ligase SrmL [Nocardia sp. IFM 10818]
MPAHLSSDQLAHDLSIRDLTDPEAGPHALQLVLRAAVDSLARQWECDVRWWRGERIVTVTDNYDNLGYRTDDVTRDARYTRYVDDHRMLRSHSTALIPGALRALAEDPADDVLLVCPGIVYRRDSIDRLHTGTPHQLDLWRITRRPVPMVPADLDDMVTALMDAVLPGAQHRYEDRVHPYTVHGRQVDVARAGEWVEIAECGLADPRVLRRAGLDHAYSGLALGMGLDRTLMLRKGITDIRLLRSTNPAVAAQLTDLAPYRPVSAMPAIRRDLSVAVDHDDRAEDLGDRVRDALGPDADYVESVEILTQTACSQLPPQALERLGARPDQKNVLLAVVLRDLTRTLTDHEANELRDRIYAAVHRGATHHWATTS